MGMETDQQFIECARRTWGSCTTAISFPLSSRGNVLPALVLPGCKPWKGGTGGSADQREGNARQDSIAARQRAIGTLHIGGHTKSCENGIAHANQKKRFY